MRENSDVEHLITLYESVGTNKHSRISKELRELFRKEILERIRNFEKRNASFFPLLTCITIDMHEIPKFEENLCGIITVNYDNLTELAIQKVKKGINYSIKVKNKIPFLRFKKRSIFPFLKLHGSFSWKKDYPLQVTDPYKLKEDDVLWVPPGVDKKRDQYPFNLLWCVRCFDFEEQRDFRFSDVGEDVIAFDFRDGQHWLEFLDNGFKQFGQYLL